MFSKTVKPTAAPVTPVQPWPKEETPMALTPEPTPNRKAIVASLIAENMTLDGGLPATANCRSTARSRAT